MGTLQELQELKARQRATWASGDYGKIAWITVPLGDVLCEVVELKPGSTVLDVATGTGHVALAAARRFCIASGIDYVPELLDVARKRAAAEGLAVEFVDGDAEDLPFADASFDFVLSAIGVMFTANHEAAAKELLRVCRFGGRIGIASWTPTGFVGEILKIASRYAPPPPGALPATRWGQEEVVRELLGSAVTGIEFQTVQITERFLSPEHFVSFFLAHYGPTLKAAERLDEDRRNAFRNDLERLARSANRAIDGTFVARWECLVAVATRV